MSQETLKITGLAHDGRGIGFLPQPRQKRGLAVFVERALPGQTVVCDIIKRAPRFCEATLVEVLASDFSPNAPHCPHQSICGGCPLQPMPYERQLRCKEKLALDALLRIGKLPEAELAAAWTGMSPSPFLRGFRNKITLAFGKTVDNSFALGFRADASHTIIPISVCALPHESAFPIIRHAAKLARASALPFYEHTGFWRFLTMRYAATPANTTPGWHALLITSPGNGVRRRLVKRFGQELLDAHPELQTFIHEERYHKDRLAIGEKRLLCLGRDDQTNDGALMMKLNERQFGFDCASFFQVNSGASEILAEKVKGLDSTGQGRLLDLFCGAGAPGQLLAEKHDICLGIEQDAAACEWATRNAIDLPGFGYERGNVTTKLRELATRCGSGKFHTVLLDPPRSGVGATGMTHILRLAPQQIIYISCNPATLARDASFLREHYRLEKLTGVDMFPYTPHLECCGLWLRQQGTL